MQEIEIELGIGDAIQIEETVYTVIDIENGEVSFRVDPAQTTAIANDDAPIAK